MVFFVTVQHVSKKNGFLGTVQHFCKKLAKVL